METEKKEALLLIDFLSASEDPLVKIASLSPFIIPAS